MVVVAVQVRENKICHEIVTSQLKKAKTDSAMREALAFGSSKFDIRFVD